jgi:CDGSH-type Zn-finger protein
LKTENEELKKQNENVKRELEYYRCQQLRQAKPFVDLTHEDISDDSDVEIIASEIPSKKRKLASPKPVDEVIELNDDVDDPSYLPVSSYVCSTKTEPAPEEVDVDTNSEKPSSIPFAPKPENNLLINPFAAKTREEHPHYDLHHLDLELFQNYILDQIPTY